MPNPAALKAGIRKGMVRVGKMKSRGKAFLKARGVMKKMMILMLMLISVMDLLAEPISWHASGTFEVGRPKKGCKAIWVCLVVEDWGLGDILKDKEGNPTRIEHGIGQGADGKLYLIINEALLRKNQPDKLEFLKANSTYFLDSEELIPQKVLNAIHYKGSGIIKAGSKSVNYENGYYFIRLN